jgi:hypothetical protein
MVVGSRLGERPSARRTRTVVGLVVAGAAVVAVGLLVRRPDSAPDGEVTKERPAVPPATLAPAPALPEEGMTVPNPSEPPLVAATPPHGIPVRLRAVSARDHRPVDPGTSLAVYAHGATRWEGRDSVVAGEATGRVVPPSDGSDPTLRVQVEPWGFLPFDATVRVGPADGGLVEISVPLEPWTEADSTRARLIVEGDGPTVAEAESIGVRLVAERVAKFGTPGSRLEAFASGDARAREVRVPGGGFRVGVEPVGFERDGVRVWVDSSRSIDLRREVVEDVEVVRVSRRPSGVVRFPLRWEVPALRVEGFALSASWMRPETVGTYQATVVGGPDVLVVSLPGEGELRHAGTHTPGLSSTIDGSSSVVLRPGLVEVREMRMTAAAGDERR